MTLDPPFAALAADPRATVRPPPAHVPLSAVRAAARAAMADPHPPGGVTVIEDAAGPVPLRLYRPANAAPGRVVIFAHGGGFVLGDLESHDGICRRLALATGQTIVAVAYRLAPEATFPAGVEDLLAVARHLQAAGTPHLAFAGDSAGGYLALAACDEALREGLAPRHLALIYPVVDPDCAMPSQHLFADGPILTRAAMQWFWACHLGSGAPWHPLRADLGHLPPCTIVTASHDPLRDEGEALARHLRGQSVATALSRIDGAPHGFLTLAPDALHSRACLATLAQGFRSDLA